jgi:hypothetical protein
VSVKSCEYWRRAVRDVSICKHTDNKKRLPKKPF